MSIFFFRPHGISVFLLFALVVGGVSIPFEATNAKCFIACTTFTAPSLKNPIPSVTVTPNGGNPISVTPLGPLPPKVADQLNQAAAAANQAVANAINELQASVLSGPALEQAINASHNSAINGSMPIPPQIRQMLTGYASEDSMNRVRYKIGDSGFVNLARLLEQGGSVAAVTLIDVIIFRGPTEAADPSIWAHELTHVDQYHAWGVHSFAVQYTRNWQSVENPAYAKGNGYWAWAQGAANGASGGVDSGQDLFNGCANIGGMKSAVGTQSINLPFVNNTHSSVDLYWIDYNGVKTFYKTVDPTQNYVQQTYITHPWEITDTSGDCLGAFVALQSGEVDIREPP